MRRNITPNTYTVSSAALSHPDPHTKPPTPHTESGWSTMWNPSETGRSLLPISSCIVRQAPDPSTGYMYECKLDPITSSIRDRPPNNLHRGEKITTSEVLFVLFPRHSPAYCIQTLRNAGCKQKRVREMRHPSRMSGPLSTFHM